jgi:hypothetical protein
VRLINLIQCRFALFQAGTKKGENKKDENDNSVPNTFVYTFICFYIIINVDKIKLINFTFKSLPDYQYLLFTP